MYLALYRKWRPRTFDDLIGQEPIRTTLKNQLKTQKNAHAYLFTGPRGTGKTSCAKMLAMALNCLQPSDGNPCLTCDHCVGIAAGSLLDVLELDAASNNSVDDVRILREEAIFAPAVCRYRIYIVDEVHMLSISAFNALLKIMEEPPAHVIFILATTEVHKVPATILSRCQRFDFARIPTAEVAAHLLAVAAAEEQFSLTEDAADAVARLADGGMRDALSILDQCRAFADTIDLETVRLVCGLISADYLLRLTDCIVQKSAAEALAMVDSLYAESKDFQRLLVDWTMHLRNLLLLKQVTGESTDLLRCLPDEIPALRQQAAQLSLADLLDAIVTIEQAMTRMARGHDKRLCVEMAVIALASERPIPVSQEKAGRANASLGSPERAPQVPQGAVNTATPSAGNAKAGSPENAKAGSPPAITEASAAGREPNNPTAPQPFSHWEAVLAEVLRRNPPLYGVLAEVEAFCLGEVLYLTSTKTVVAPMMKQPGFAKCLQQILQEQTGVTYRLRVQGPAAAQAGEAATSEGGGAPVSALQELEQKLAEQAVPIHPPQNS